MEFSEKSKMAVNEAAILAGVKGLSNVTTTM